MAPHNLYRCAGPDDWVAVCCSTEDQWQELAKLLDIQAEKFATQASRKRNEDDLDTLIEKWTIIRDKWEVTQLLQEVGVPAMPSLDVQSLETDPHLNHRGFIERLEHPIVGKMAHTGIPWLLRDGPNGVRAPAPMLGQHTDEILSSLLRLSTGEIQDLRDEGVLG
jgi:crotonobetainyl-CoA:carnitine CoA-transferase CaiB-like acyl-CoA transferase